MNTVATRNWTKGILTAVLLMMGGCQGGEDPAPTPPDPVRPVSQTVDILGGTLRLSNGASLQIPPEALDSLVQVTMKVAEATPPSELEPASPLLQLEPADTVFARRVRVSLPMTSDVTNPTVYWLKEDGSGYEAIGGEVENGAIVAEVLHLGKGFVGKSKGTRSVRGVNTDTWLTENRVKLVPQDLTQTGVSALVLGADGKFTEYKGIGRKDGTFTIPDVPNGTFYLKRGTTYLVTDRSALDLGSAHGGRSDIVKATRPTTLNLSATNLNAWQKGDRLAFFSTNSNTWFFNLETLSTNQTAVGATSLSGLRFSSSTNLTASLTANLIDGTKGDRGILAQLSQRTSAGGVPYTAMSRVVEFEPFTQVDGQEQVLTGDMVEVSTAKTISLDLKTSQFGPHTADITPGATRTEFMLSVQGLPGGNERGMFTAAADFLLLSAAMDADVDTSIMHYGMPLSGNWGVNVLARASVHTEYRLPGTTRAAHRQSASIETIDPVSGSPTTMTIAPRHSPVRQPKLNGTSLFTPASDVGDSPVITWEPPALGTPSHYELIVRRLYLDSTGNTRALTEGTLYTRDTQVRIPPDLMRPGESYYLVLGAMQSTTMTPDAPFRDSIPSAHASVLSAIIQMAPAP